MRRRIARGLKGLLTNLSCRLWSLSRRLRHGPTCWIQAHGYRPLCVRVDDERAQVIDRQRGTQKEKIAVWRELAALRPDVIIDVGANYGEFSAAVADTNLPVIAVEANPVLIDCLRQTFAADRNVTIRHAAAAAEDGAATMFFDRHSTGSGTQSPLLSQSRRALSRQPVSLQQAPVPASRLDTLVPEVIGRTPRSLILKIDVEGYEDAVLEGAEHLLDSAAWWRIMLEFSPICLERAGRDSQDVWQALSVHCGAIVGPAMNTLDLLDGSSRLPENFPAHGCDIVLARGALSAKRASHATSNRRNAAA